MSHHLSVYDLAFIHRQKDPSASGVDPTSVKRLKRHIYDHYGNLLPNAQDYIPRSYYSPDQPAHDSDKGEGPSSTGMKSRHTEEDMEDKDYTPPKARRPGRPKKRPISYRSGHTKPSTGEETKAPSSAQINEKDLPSEALLEAIYRFASQHYTQIGALPKKRYQWKKERRRWNARETVDTSTESDMLSQTGSDSSNVDDEEGAGLSEVEVEEPDSADPGTEGETEEGEPHIDMRNAFDGSALIAMALILQEQMKADIKRAYCPPKPQGDSPPTPHLLEELLDMASMEVEDLSGA